MSLNRCQIDCYLRMTVGVQRHPEIPPLVYKYIYIDLKYKNIVSMKEQW